MTARIVFADPRMAAAGRHRKPPHWQPRPQAGPQRPTGLMPVPADRPRGGKDEAKATISAPAKPPIGVTDRAQACWANT